MLMMPKKKKRKSSKELAKEFDPRRVAAAKELVGSLMDGYAPEDLLSSGGLLRTLTKAIVERALEAEMSDHLGYEKGQARATTSNGRNGSGCKSLHTESGEVSIEVPRDRNGTFEPQLVRKRQTRVPGLDDKIIGLYGRGMSVRDIRDQLQQMYGADVSPDLISSVTDAVLEEVKAWRNRPLDPVYPVVYLDALVVKGRDGGLVKNKHVYVALGLNMAGKKEVLGLWIQRTEGAKFWLQILTELKNRGIKDVLIACTDGLTGFADAIEATFPNTIVQTCIVHLLRNSVRYVGWKERKVVLADLKPIYTAANEEAALEALAAFDDKWQHKYPMISQSWESAWERVVPFLAFPAEIRKVIYTTNSIGVTRYAGTTQRVRNPTSKGARTMKLRRRFAGESRGRCLLTNPEPVRGATLRAAGIERCAGLEIVKHRKPSLPIAGEGIIDNRNLADTVVDSGGVLAAARSEGLYTELAKPSWPRGETPRSKVDPGNGGRRPEGGRLARRSREPLAMRRDPAKSRGTVLGWRTQPVAKGPS